ncbi:Growth arrest-specific protein 8 [Nibea albiflora]|uniref:Growth arrest-specific protein 8 n=1 Tax=Nibea albiflora TaxID=240163 RepID=A0ACB7FK51_NIBAL|nr:Growth arrest-specific protein 8 [Nibea albiflora]
MLDAGNVPVTPRIDGMGFGLGQGEKGIAADAENQHSSDFWKIPVGAVVGAALMLLSILTMRLISKKRRQTNASVDKSGTEAIYEEIQAGTQQPRRESDVESPYYCTSFSEIPSTSTSPNDNLYSTVNKIKTKGCSKEECVYYLAEDPTQSGKPTKNKNKKAGKGKTSAAVVDGLSTVEMSKDQLQEHIIRLREELDKEQEERSFFQLERDKIQAFWEISKRSLEEMEAELRSRQREREEAEERHRVEITVYKQKLKHVLSGHHNNNNTTSTSLIQNQHAQSGIGHQKELRGLQVDFREKKLDNEDFIRELKLKHQVELMELANGYERRLREIEVKYHKKMQSLMEAEGRKRRAEINEFEDRANSRVVALVEDHDRALRGAEEHHSMIQTKLVEEQKLLKEELAEVKKQHARVDKKLSAAERENKRLYESLQEAQQKLPELRKQLEDDNQAKTAMSRARAKVTEKELRDLTVEHELLLQAFENVQQERDELLKKQTEVILDIQQKNGLKELLLERKLAALTETLEKKEAQLCAALSASSVDQPAGSSAANNLEVYDDLLQICKERLETLGVPLYGVTFRPSEQIMGGHAWVQNSVGPASNH